MKHRTRGGFDKYGKTTRRAQFLADMDRIISWPELIAALATVDLEVSDTGATPRNPRERMLRIYLLQWWFDLSDRAVEEALYDSAAMRNFAGIDLGEEGAPDERVIREFRKLLERYKLDKILLNAVNDPLHRNGIRILSGRIVDATIGLRARIRAPSTTRPCTSPPVGTIRNSARKERTQSDARGDGVSASDLAGLMAQRLSPRSPR